MVPCKSELHRGILRTIDGARALVHRRCTLKQGVNINTLKLLQE